MNCKILYYSIKQEFSWCLYFWIIIAMFSTLAFKQKESTLTKRKFKYLSFRLMCGRIQNSGDSMAAKAAENTNGARKGIYHRKWEYSPTESKHCRWWKFICTLSKKHTSSDGKEQYQHETPVSVWDTLQRLQCFGCTVMYDFITTVTL